MENSQVVLVLTVVGKLVGKINHHNCVHVHNKGISAWNHGPNVSISIQHGEFEESTNEGT